MSLNGPAVYDQGIPASPSNSMYSMTSFKTPISATVPHAAARSRLCTSSHPQAPAAKPTYPSSPLGGMTLQQSMLKPLSHAALHLLHAAAHLLLWRTWAAAATGPEQQWADLRSRIMALGDATPGLLAAAWRSWGALQQGPVKEEGLALLLAQAGSLPALAHNQRLLLAVAQQVAPLQASPSTGPLTTWLAASPSFQALLAQEPALMDAYLLELGRWSQRRRAHQCAAWKVLAALPRCLVVPLAQQRLHSSDRPVVVGAGVALTQL